MSKYALISALYWSALWTRRPELVPRAEIFSARLLAARVARASSTTSCSCFTLRLRRRGEERRGPVYRWSPWAERRWMSERFNGLVVKSCHSKQTRRLWWMYWHSLLCYILGFYAMQMHKLNQQRKNWWLKLQGVSEKKYTPDKEWTKILNFNTSKGCDWWRNSPAWLKGI